MCNCVVEGGVVMKKRGGGLVNKPMWWGGGYTKLSTSTIEGIV
jgi:hypothetical protein